MNTPEQHETVISFNRTPAPSHSSRMTPKEINQSIAQLDSRINTLRDQIALQEKVREDIITSAPPDILPHAEPLLYALVHGRQEQPGVLGIFNPFINHLRAIDPIRDSPTNFKGGERHVTSKWDGKGTLELSAMIDELEARKSILIASLPSEEEMLEAERSLSDLLSELTAQEEVYAAKWSDLLSSLESTALTVEDFRLSIPDTKSLHHRANKLAETYGLSVPSPSTDMKHNLSPHDKRAVSFAFNLAKFIMHTLRDSGVINGLEVTGADTLEKIYAPLERDLEEEKLSHALDKARRSRNLSENRLETLREEISTLTLTITELEEKVYPDNVRGNGNGNGNNPDFITLRKKQAMLEDAVRQETKERRDLDTLTYTVKTLESKLASLPEKTMRKRTSNPETGNVETVFQ